MSAGTIAADQRSRLYWAAKRKAQIAELERELREAESKARGRYLRMLRGILIASQNAHSDGDAPNVLDLIRGQVYSLIQSFEERK